MVYLYNTETNSVTWSGDAYIVDGQPGKVDPPLIQLTDAPDEAPAPRAGMRLEAYSEVDVANKLMRHRWREVPIPLVPKTKLELGKIMGRPAFTYLEGVMAGMLASEDENQQKLGWYWSKATEIDPNDPETQAGLDALVAMGVITIPIAELFAP